MPDVIVLCGGAGTRLRGVVGSTPKAMADVAGRPFLELLLRQLQRHEFQRVILAVGAQSETISQHFGQRAFGLQLVYSYETSPLGTGGALGHAADLVHSNDALVTNGDSYTDVDLSAFVMSHRTNGDNLSLVVVRYDGRTDCGTVLLSDSGNAEAFLEKTQMEGGKQYHNAGLYIISKSLLCAIPPRVEISLEKELLPQWLNQGLSVGSFLAVSECIDIGTPERYCRAQHTLANVEKKLDVFEAYRSIPQQESS